MRLSQQAQRPIADHEAPPYVRLQGPRRTIAGQMLSPLLEVEGHRSPVTNHQYLPKFTAIKHGNGLPDRRLPLLLEAGEEPSFET